jgi:ABC-2 type transport system permease protein
MNESLRNVWTIAKRELTGYFASPVAYVFIVIFLLLNGFFTFMLGGFFEAGEASLARPFFNWHPWLYLFLVPAAGMRLWADERRVGTLELLLTLPITPWQAILGKFLACWLFLALALFLTFPIVLTVAYLGSPDLGTILTGYLGSLLLSGVYLSVAATTSALTRNQVVSPPKAVDRDRQDHDIIARVCHVRVEEVSFSHLKVSLDTIFAIRVKVHHL